MKYNRRSGLGRSRSGDDNSCIPKVKRARCKRYWPTAGCIVRGRIRLAPDALPLLKRLHSRYSRGRGDGGGEFRCHAGGRLDWEGDETVWRMLEREAVMLGAEGS